MLFKSSDDGFSDFKGVLALHKDYVTAEPFIPDRECDLRIQKIGDHYRVYKRVSSNWKGNVGSSVIEEIPVTDTYKMWAEECGKLFGGMDILTVDAIRTKDGKGTYFHIFLAYVLLAPAAHSRVSAPVPFVQSTSWRSTILRAGCTGLTKRRIWVTFAI